ncbi:MAG: phenylalanine--tRNA ligase subunit alpha, partial [Rhodobacteraceae bacterium]|nr:phenylalanine--tRNA ligase subunit alpha [Paracoccaceae bacterium]
MDDLENLRAGVLKHISEVSDEGELENLRLRFLGKKGEISLKMRELGSMSPEQKMTYGPLLNSLKGEINSALIAKKTAFQDTALDERLRTEWLDVTLPSRVRSGGTIHPVSQVTEEVTEIFADMGFLVAEGPQIESDWYNFDALNIPSHHPARGEMDTFYMKHQGNSSEPPHVLRT